MKKTRPVCFSPLSLWLPVGGVVSLLHRLSGLLLFLALPLLLYLFQLSLQSPNEYYLITINYELLLKLFVWIMGGVLLHHVLAGTRLLLMDTGVGKTLSAARRSAKWVMLADVAAFLVLGAWLW